MFVVAPLSANTLAKMANGMCDNLLTCVVRAWDFSKPLLVAPAMNTYMWDSPFTTRHLEQLEALGVTVVDPVSKKLACGDVGNGAMAWRLLFSMLSFRSNHDGELGFRVFFSFSH